MIDVLGWPLFKAVFELEKSGYTCQVVENSCKKGAAGDDKRVIAQKLIGNNKIELKYSGFNTLI